MAVTSYCSIFSKLSKYRKEKLKQKIRYYLKRAEINEIKQLIQHEGGIDYAERQIKRFSIEAREELSVFPDSIYKEALLSVLSFNRERII